MKESERGGLLFGDGKGTRGQLAVGKIGNRG